MKDEKMKLPKVPKGIKLKVSDWGIAYRCPNNVIEINPLLLKNKKLLARVLKHELGHTSKGSMDFWHDLNNQAKLGNDFFFKYPKASLQSMMPIWHHKGAWCHNNFLILIYSVMLLMLSVAFFVLSKRLF